MTQEEKDLLLRELSSRLPYGVKVNHKGLIRPLFSVSPTQCYQVTLDNAIDGKHNGLELVSLDGAEEVKPYLRPMSSMTEEEIKTYHSYCECNDGDFTGEILYFDTIESFDYLTSIHIDYRGLILMCLALEAPEGMYN